MSSGTYQERDLVRVLGVIPTGSGTFEDATQRLDKAFDLTSSPTAYYIGYAPLGSSTASPVWTIKRITLASGVPTRIHWTASHASAFDNRSTETYT